MDKKLIVTLVVATLSTSALAEGVNLNLNPVVVTATRSATNSFDLPVSIDVVDGETIRDNRLGANLSEVAPRVPGVIINNRYNAAQELAISTRGFGARSAFGVKGVRIYIDGIPLTTPDGQGQLGALNLDTVGQVEFMRGPFSALYGNSSGGVVQAITRDGSKTPTLSGGITFGSYNTKREFLTFEGQQGDVNYIMSTSQITSNGYRDHSEYRRDNFNTKVSFNLNEDTKLTLIANYMNQPYTQDPQSLRPSDFKLDPTQAKSNSVPNNTRVYREQTVGGLTLDHNINENNSIRFMTYYGVRDNLQYLPGSASGFNRDFSGADLRWTYKNNIYGKPLTFSAGLNYDLMKDQDRKRWNTTNGEKTSLTRNEDQRASNLDQYVQASFEPTDQLLLIAGLRHSKVKMKVEDMMPLAEGDSSGNLEYSNTSPAFGATFKVTPTLNLYANYGRGFETPTFAEMSYTCVNSAGCGTLSYGAGPNLLMKPSKTRNYEVGAKAFVTDNTRVNVALFKIDAKNEIVVDSNNSTKNTSVYSSVAETERKGIELSLDSRLPYNFGFYGAYTLMDAEFTKSFKSFGGTQSISSGNKIPGTFVSSSYSELSWKYPAYGFSAAAEAIYFGSTNAYDDNRSSHRADAYTLFNLRGGFTQTLGNWKLTEFARIDNISDRSYVSSIKVNNDYAFEPGATKSYMLGINASYMFR